MNTFAAALAQAEEALNDAPDSPGVYRRAFAFCAYDHDFLAWLSAQAAFPQFYWRSRDGDEEVAALGAAQAFASLDEAQAFLRQHEDEPDLRACGLNAFDPAHGFLFLPRLALHREGERASLVVTLFSEHSRRQAAEALQRNLRSLQTPRLLPPGAPPLVSRCDCPQAKAWTRLVARASEAIARGDIAKVVLARATDLRFASPPDAAALMAASREANHYCYHFYLAFSARDVFLGSTPERLWRREGCALATEALAGTVENHPDDAQASARAAWLQDDDKNRRENALVVDDICARLQAIARDVHIQVAQVVRLRRVQHLKRVIFGRLLRADDAACLRQLQPTAAVAGLPREAARRFITDNEPFDRAWYAGSAGYLSKEKTEFCVSLRAARITDDTVRLYAGAGLVAGSEAALEWQEIENKAAALLSLLTG
ncbi:Menaquinone-specific isochorismate synthase [Cronobacter condimenti 1330]|uniref:Isochorismate synthase MenF n=1 Tax=Cronobacter condimenti 1330 TaxID=1073999 RepID=K7ZYT0_9ENTR|nr:isochorismate synthase MenF [Cronobacter condimenti]ALB63426.1 isochorismate synthase [Cronobacter condimenti 1330]CCJ71280.1 Menaquinone-specific isochorismate synthase [Cronobacter condimenti 1330]